MRAHTHKNADLHGSAPDHSSTVLLLIDLISDFEFPDGARMFKRALAAARRIKRLKTRCKAAGIPAIYVNDNLGRWRSDFAAVVRRCTKETARGAPIARLLSPEPDDYCILKAKHSGFYATPLDTLLSYIGARRLIITGLSSHQCVLFTANDAYVRDFELHIPRDCICAPTSADTDLALTYFKKVLGADTALSSRLRVSRKR